MWLWGILNHHRGKNPRRLFVEIETEEMGTLLS